MLVAELDRVSKEFPAADGGAPLSILKDLSLQARLETLLGKFGLPTRFPRMRKDRILEVALRDKKVRKGRIRMVLPVRAGRVVVRPVPLAMLKAVL